MHFIISFPVICFLKDSISPNRNIPQFLKFAFIQRSDLYIYPSNAAALFIFDRINSFYGIKEIIKSAIFMMLAHKHKDTFMTLPQYFQRFIFDLIHSQNNPLYIFIVHPEAAVKAVVGTVIRYIKRCKKYEAVPVYFSFYF